MGLWRETILDYLRNDYLEEKAGSFLCEYLREKYEADSRVRLKRAFAGVESDDDSVLAVELCVSLLLGERRLAEFDAVVEIAGEKAPDETDRAYDARVRKLFPAEPTAWPTISGAQVRSLANGLIGRMKPKSTLCVQAMECCWDLRSGGRRLGSKQESEDLLDSVCTKLGDAPPIAAYRHNRANSKRAAMLAEYLESEVFPALICRDAETWLDNHGISLTGVDDRRFIAKTSDIPVDLVEECVRGAPKLANKLGLQSTTVAARARMSGAGDNRYDAVRDLEALYSALVKSKNGSAVLPVAIDSKTGFGLYVLGFGYANKADRDVVDGAFSAYLAANRARYPKCTLGRIRVPFFAIMYLHWDMRAELIPSDRNPETGRCCGLPIISLWDYVVEAWIPQGHSFAREALARFNDQTSKVIGLEAYQARNGSIIPGCPEWYRDYFNTDLDF